MGMEDTILQLSNVDECDRIYAAEDIGLAGAPEGAAPLFGQLLNEPSQAVREAIFAALARLPNDSVLQGAVQLLSHDDPGIRNQALELLQSRGNSVVPELRHLLAAPGSDLRKFAVDVLSRIETPESEELLAIAIADRDVNVVITALENIRHCHSRALRQEVLRHALSGGHPMLVLAALDALGRVGDAECYRQVRERFPRLKAMPSIYLEPALRLVGMNGENGDLVELQSFLASCEPKLRAAVLDALRNILARAGAAELPDAWWQGLLATLPETTSAAERYQTLALLGHFGQRKQVVEVLIAFLQSPVKVDRLGAIEALGQSRCESACCAMRSRLKMEADPEVRQALEDAFCGNGQ